MKTRFLLALALVWVIAATDFAGSSKADANRAPFSLVTHLGEPVTDEDFLGAPMLVFFGYTHCPDICPIDLTIQTEVVETLDEDGISLQPVFITIDPVRDTVARMASFVANFHPRLVGLTGHQADVDAIAKRYGVGARRAPAGDSTDPADYWLDHTAAMYLIGADGGGRAFFHHGTPAEEIIFQIKGLLSAE